MTRRGRSAAMRRGRADWLHGALIVDKPPGMTSAAVVADLRRRLDVASIGHTGTLDPLASGVLPIVVGQGTKLAGYLLAEDKGYDAIIELGVETDTLDRDGVVTARDPVAAARVTEAMVRAALAARVGVQVQEPPAISAIKVDGRRLYDRVRDGEAVVVPSRTVTFHALELLGFAAPRLTVRVACSKGSFVRSLARDLGRDLGCGAHIAELRRTQAGRFTLAQAHPLAALHRTSAPGFLLPLAEVADLPRVDVDAATATEAEHGRRVPMPDRPEGAPFQLVTPEGWVIAVATVVNGLATYERVLRRDSFVEVPRVARAP